jgi:guanylate kinase
MERKRRMFAFTAPSGAGKTTVVRHLLSNYEFLDFSISATTRAKREHEVDGRDYYFLSPDDFKRKIEEEAFIEWEEVYADQFYGTLHSEVERVWEKGKNIIFDIDVKGAASLKKAYGDDCFVTFISPPSLEILIDRLKGRNTESIASLKKRIDRVTREMTYQNTFDTVLFNDVLEVTFHDARAIVENFIFEKDSLKA